MRILKRRHNIAGDYFEITKGDKIFSLSTEKYGVVLEHYIFINEFDIQWDDGSISDRVNLNDVILQEDVPSIIAQNSNVITVNFRKGEVK